MRITNSMITGNTKSNINSNKLLVDKYNTQMTTQKKISKASENPVIAIRSLRLSTTLSHLNQYVDNNIPDASAWMDVTETALTNMKDLITDIRTQCVNGSTDSKNEGDRKIILDNLTALAEQVYAEGNADYAGKSVFTGYRTSSKLTFEEDEPNTKYRIDQDFDYSDLEEKRYYTGDVTVPEALTENVNDCTTEIAVNTYERVRLAYGGDTKVNSFTYGYDIDKNERLEVTAKLDTATGNYTVSAKSIELDGNGNPVKDSNGNVVSTDLVNNNGVFEKRDADGNTVKTYSDIQVPTFTAYANEAAWEKPDANATPAKEYGKIAGENEIIYIEETGEFVFGKAIANDISDKRCTMNVNYDKTGFEEGDLRPEYYYDCIDKTADDTDESLWIRYTKENQEIKYTVANNTTITINTQADEVFDSSIKRDVVELINVVQKSIDANEKVKKLEAMMEEEQYKDADSQARLQSYLDAAQKEADYADDNLQKTYEAYIDRFDGYLQNVSIAITNIGSVGNNLKLTQTRVENQQMTIEELKSSNEDRDISDIIIDYYAAYNAYQSSLTAAGKLGKTSLLDYI